MKNKRGMELAISTVITIILCLLVLVFGIVFIKNSMCKAIDGIGKLDDFTSQQISLIFEEQLGNVAVKEKLNEIPKKVSYGVGFAIKNENKRTNTDFSYDISVADLGDCDITEREAESYILTGKRATIPINFGDTFSEILHFKIPKEAPYCSLKYKIEVENEGESYGIATFDVVIKPTGLAVMC
jgi:hypothetical protein